MEVNKNRTFHLKYIVSRKKEINVLQMERAQNYCDIILNLETDVYLLISLIGRVLG
jgi:hypothetical protein